MYKDHANDPQQSTTSRSNTQTDNPLPDVPFMGIAAVLGFLVLVLLAAAAYSISETLGTITIDPQMWGPAVFMLLVVGLFWLVDRYQPRTYSR
jgi:hypothetical protein